MKYILGALALAICVALPPNAKEQQQAGPSRMGSACQDQADSLISGRYAEIALSTVWPPAFPMSQGITISVGTGNQLFLHTDGIRFELWTNRFGIPGQDIRLFLTSLAEACRLPRDPGDSLKLMKVSWESKSLNPSQFTSLHGDFLKALSEYVRTVEESSDYFMATRLQNLPVDASYYPILYDNTRQHFQIKAWDLPIKGHTDPIIEWVHELQRVAEQSFHRPFGKPN